MNKKNIKDKIFIIISLVVYMIITFIITMHHENWRDEAQSFMIAQNLSFVDIFKQLKYEGHPFVFYYLVKIFTILGFEYRIVNIISWLVMSIVAYIILAKSPFNKITKVLILLTIPFVYQYVAFGRSYCLITLFTILLAYMYNKKEKHPYIYAILIALLMNTHIIVLGFALMLVLTFYVYELIFNRKKLNDIQKRKYIISLGIIFVAGILLILQFHSTLSLNSYTKSYGLKADLSTRIAYVTEIAVYLYSYVLTNDIYISMAVTVMIILTLLLTIKFKPIKEILILFGTMGYQLLFFFCIGEAKTYILMTLFVVYVFFIWTILSRNQDINDEKSKQFKICISITFSAVCLCSILFGSIRAVYLDIKNEYSSSKSAAAYIENNINEEAVFLCIDDTLCESIIPYLNDKYYFYSLISEEYYKFVNWDENRNIGVSTSEYISRINKFFEKNQDLEEVYIIFNWAPNEVYEYFLNEGQIEFKYKVTKSYEFIENYYIYKFVK